MSYYAVKCFRKKDVIISMKISDIFKAYYCDMPILASLIFANGGRMIERITLSKEQIKRLRRMGFGKPVNF